MMAEMLGPIDLHDRGHTATIWEGAVGGATHAAYDRFPGATRRIRVRVPFSFAFRAIPAGVVLRKAMAGPMGPNTRFLCLSATNALLYARERIEGFAVRDTETIA